jgi:uncharacterized protein with NRDE domain
VVAIIKKITNKNNMNKQSKILIGKSFLNKHKSVYELFKKINSLNPKNYLQIYNWLTDESKVKIKNKRLDLKGDMCEGEIMAIMSIKRKDTKVYFRLKNKTIYNEFEKIKPTPTPAPIQNNFNF